MEYNYEDCITNDNSLMYMYIEDGHDEKYREFIKNKRKYRSSR